MKWNKIHESKTLLYNSKIIQMLKPKKGTKKRNRKKKLQINLQNRDERTIGEEYALCVPPNPLGEKKKLPSFVFKA